MSFPDQEKLLKEEVFGLAVSMNANTKNSQIKHCPCPKYFIKFTDQKKHPKNDQELKFIFQNMSL